MNPEQLRLFARIEDHHWWFVARRRIIHRLIAEVLPPERGGTILDIGCGAGANLGELAGDYTCVGVDTSPTAIELAGQRFPRAAFVLGNAPESVAGVVASADLIVMMDVIEHVADDFLFFSKIVAGAKPGALVLVTVPADMGLWSPHDETVLHYRRYDGPRLEAVWAGLPLKPRLVSHFNTRLYPLVKLMRSRSRKRGRGAGAAGTDFTTPPAPVNALLRHVFGGEARRVLRALDAPPGLGYARGVSLVALLERQAGSIEPRAKPARFAADPFAPAG
jgi:SAM-dependent methyltransferase